MSIDFKMNPYHFFDSKLLDIKSDFVASYDWKQIIEERRHTFSEYSFFVTDNESGILHSDFITNLELNETEIHINFNSDNPKHIYWIHLQTGRKEIFLSFDKNVNLVHENLVVQTIRSIAHLEFKSKSTYTNIIQNESTGIFELSLEFKNFDENSYYFLQQDSESKNKVNQKHYLSKLFAESNIFILNKIKPKQLRDDFIEFEHSCSETKSEIKYFSLNGGKSVSQVNSIIPSDIVQCETHQHIKHILISDKAQSYSKPNLMIKNPNVIASHGNSIGSYSDEELFYLMQRGIELDTAKKIIQTGIINQALEHHPEYDKMKGFF